MDLREAVEERRVGLPAQALGLAGRYWRGLWTFSKRSPVGGVSLVALIIIVFVAVFAGQISPYSPLDNNYARLKEEPCRDFWLGTDNLGRDILSRVLHGTRISLIVGFASTFLGVAIGGLWGLASGYLGGKFDLYSQRVVDSLMAFPGLILAMMLVLVLGRGMETVIIAIGVACSVQAVRVIRSVALSVREYTYVDAARAIGASNSRILFVHVLPNALAATLIVASTRLGAAIVTEASLGFLGLGIPPPTPTWGNMLSGTVALKMDPLWWMVVFPGVAITITVMAFNLFGDSVRDALDPRLRGSRAPA
ncbi:ABC transporter permease [Chloroflexota bacterium]